MFWWTIVFILVGLFIGLFWLIQTVNQSNNVHNDTRGCVRYDQTTTITTTEVFRPRPRPVSPKSMEDGASEWTGGEGGGGWWWRSVKADWVACACGQYKYRRWGRFYRFVCQQGDSSLPTQTSPQDTFLYRLYLCLPFPLKFWLSY